MKILIVDDDENVRAVLRLIIEHQRHIVLEAGDGMDGLAMARKHTPDAIISDGLMPRMDGFQFLMAIRRDATLRTVPFVMHTAIYTEDKEREFALSLGADALITKPIRPDAFWKEFTSVIEASASGEKQVMREHSAALKEEELQNYRRMVVAKLEKKVQEQERTIIDHERTKKTLFESEERYRLLFESNPHPMWVYDRETLAFLAVNDAALSQYGYSRGEFLSMTIKDLRQQEDVPHLIDKVSRSAEGLDAAGTWRHRKKDGTIFDAEITTHTLTFDARQAKLVMAIDVTERRRMEKAIHDAVGEWRNTLDAMDEAIALLDGKGTILRCNRAMASLFKKQFHEIIGRQCWEIIHNTSGPAADCPHEIMKKTLKRETVAAQLGDQWFDVTTEPFLDSEGELVGAVHIMADITERKHIEETLKASEEKYRDLFENANDAIFLLDSEQRFTDANKASEVLTGYTREELLTMKVFNLIPLEQARRSKIEFEKLMTKGSYGKFTGQIRRKDGRLVHVDVSSSAIIKEGRMAGSRDIVRDITERKLAEESLERQKRFTENLIQNSAIPTFVLDARHNVLLWNKACEELTGLPASTMVNTDLSWKPFYGHQRPVLGDIVLGGDGEKLSKLYPEVSRSVITPGGLHAEGWFENLNNKKRYLVFDAAPIRDISGGIVAAIETVQDYTSRKKLEDDLIQAKQEWEETFNTITDMVTVHDKDFNIIRSNNAAKNILGLSFLNVDKTKCYKSYHGTDCAPKGCPSCQSLVTGKPATSEIFEPHLNMFIEIRTIPRMDSAGAVNGLIHVVRDISERKNAEDILKAERNKAQTYLDIAGVLIVALDAEGLVTLVNKRGLEITGYEEQEMLGRSWFDLCIPEPMREEVRKVFNSLMTGSVKPVEYFENTILRKDGLERILAFHNAVVRTESGDVSGILSSGEDITEQKWAHDQLNQRVHQAALGAEVGVALTRGGDLRATLQLCAKAITHHLNAAFSRIWTLNEQENVLELQASAGMYTHINGAHGRVPVGKFKVGRIAEERKPHLTNQVIGDPRIAEQEWARKEGMVAFAGYPLIVQDRLVGVMAMFSRSRIPETTMSSVASVADVIALGIERKKNEESLREYGNELTALNMASNNLMLITNLSDLYPAICDIVYSVFSMKMVWLGIIEKGVYEVKPVAHAGEDAGYLSSIRVTWDDSPTGMGPTGMSIKTMKSHHVNVKDPSFAPWSEAAQLRGYVASLSVPLIYARDKCIGALSFYSEKRDYFTPDRIKICEIFANQASIAIENASLIEDLEGKVLERTREIEDTNIELQAVNRELWLRRDEAEMGSRSKSEFLANMSHELRTPLNAVIGLSQVLLDQTFGPLNAKQSEYLDGVKQSGNHLLELINEILDLSKIEAGKEQLEPAVFSISETLRNAFMMVRGKAMKHRIELIQDIGSEVGLFYADERRVKQILFNLLSNAVKFTEPGGNVGLKAHQDIRTLTITVWDTGVGIPESKRHLVFQPFQQLDSSLSKKHEGTGLGLVLSKRLVEMHGGTITFGPREGGGTNFIVTLPALSFTQPGTQPHGGQAQEKPQGKGGLVAGKKIMIVEDNRLNMLLVADFLKGNSFTVVEATTGEVALEKAAQEKPDVILLDIQMPGIDGFEVLRRLRESPEFKDIPVIAMTALAMKGDEERCMRAGFNDYIRKPVNLNEMLNKIERRLS